MRWMHQYAANRNVFRDCLKLFPCASTTTPCSKCPLLQVGFQKCPRRGSVRVRTPPCDSDRIRSQDHTVGRIGSGVRVSNSFHILCCVVVRAVLRSGFRDTLSWWTVWLLVVLIFLFWFWSVAAESFAFASWSQCLCCIIVLATLFARHRWTCSRIT